MVKSKKSIVDIIKEQEPWVDGLFLLREIIISTELNEEVKWGIPTYTLDGKNVLGIAGFKHFFSIWFHQGVFLKDPANVLITASEGRTRGLRQWRFTSTKEINEGLVKQYIDEAIENARKGKEIKPTRRGKVAVPIEFENAFKKDPFLKAAFAKLSPGKQREYLEYVAEAKTEDTRERRLVKSITMMLAGMGLNDKYKK